MALTPLDSSAARVRAKKRAVWGSYSQRGSLTKELGGVVCPPGAMLKNWVIGTAEVSGAPVGEYTFHAVLTPSMTKPLPTQRAWSGGSRPPLVPAYLSGLA